MLHSLVLASFLLATSFFTPTNGTYMTLPAWMPRTVLSADTFGSEEHADASLRITTNTLSAMEATFDAYYERLYFQGAAGMNDTAWTTNSYGPRELTQMTFPGAKVNYRNGNRTVPDTRRLVEFDQILQFSGGAPFRQMIDTTEPIIWKDSWGTSSNSCKYVAFSSTFMSGAEVPPAFAWTTADPAASYFTNALPLFACTRDTSFHTAVFVEQQLPIAEMFNRACSSYFSDTVYDLLPKTLNIDTPFDEKINAAFTVAGKSHWPNSQYGIGEDTSRRLKPDDYWDQANYSSLLATVGRALALMDRTHELPEYYPERGSLSNVTRQASRSLKNTYQGTLVAYDVDFGEDTGEDGTFRCDMFSEADLSLVSQEASASSNETVGTTTPAGYDVGRFDGTQTSVTSTFGEGITNLLLGTVGDLINNAYCPDYGPLNTGIVYASASVWKRESGIYFDMISEYPTVTTSVGTYLYGRSFPLVIEDSATVTRSAGSFRTRQIGADTSAVLLPYPLPCASAFEHPSRILRHTTSFLQEVNLVHGAYETMHLKMRNMAGGDVLGSPLVAGYTTARQDSYGRITTILDAQAAGWQNPLGLCAVAENFIEKHVQVEGGTVSVKVSIDGHDVEDNVFVFDLNSIPAVGTYILRVGYYDAEGNVQWLDSDAEIWATLYFTPDNSQSGFTLREDVTDIPSCEATSYTVPMVTTVWDWRALRKEN